MGVPLADQSGREQPGSAAEVHQQSATALSWWHERRSGIGDPVQHRKLAAWIPPFVD
ncbi:MAG TPA: hypothetical protein VIJ76_06585 [Galbitalea sp.]